MARSKCLLHENAIGVLANLTAAYGIPDQMRVGQRSEDEKDQEIKENIMRQTLTIFMLLSLLALAGCGGSGTDRSKEPELKERELRLKEKELELKATPSKESDPVQAGNTNKTETVKTSGSATTKGCQPTNAVSFKKGTFSQNFKCRLSVKASQHKYTLYAKAGQMFDIQFEATGAGFAPDAVYKVVNPDGVVKRDKEGENSGLQLDKSGKWTVTVDLSPTPTEPSVEYTITFTIGDGDPS